MEKSWKNLVVVAVVAVLTGQAVLPAGAADDQKNDKGPIGFWRFEGETDAQRKADSSKNNNKVAVFDRVEFVTGRTGQALKFTAPAATERSKSGIMLLSFADKYDFTKGFTFEAWIKPAREFNMAQRFELISNLEKDTGKGLSLHIGHNKCMWFVSGEGGTTPLYGAKSTWKLDLSPDKWHHVAGTYDGGCFMIYLNGVMIAKSEAGLKLTKGRPYFYVGSFINGFAYGFDGLMDDVKIYDYARTAEEISKDAAGE
jgi:hypothetical protein